MLARVGGLGPLEPLLADPAVTEVMVNGPGDVWVERSGRLVRTTIAWTRPTIDALIARIVAPLGLRVDRSSPLVDARLADGSRVNAVIPPLAVDGPCLTVRRFRVDPVPLAAMAPAAAGRTARDGGGRAAEHPGQRRHRRRARPRCSTRWPAPIPPPTG